MREMGLKSPVEQPRCRGVGIRNEGDWAEITGRNSCIVEE